MSHNRDFHSFRAANNYSTAAFHSKPQIRALGGMKIRRLHNVESTNVWIETRLHRATLHAWLKMFTPQMNFSFVSAMPDVLKNGFYKSGMKQALVLDHQGANKHL